jgi:Flp pilus assembly protein TadG
MSSSRRARVARRQGVRAGVAATELAVCMPVLVLIIVATIEASSLLYLQQSLSVACYEAARVALVPESTTSNVTYQADLILQSRGVRDSQVVVSPGDITAAAEGTWLKVEASAPFRSNSLMGGWLFKSRRCTAQVQMVKEH